MSNDRFDALRKALEAGPTRGPWISVHGYNENYVYAPDARYPTLHGNESEVKVAWLPPYPARTDIPERDARYIAACDPDTIRALLAERDALMKELQTEKRKHDVESFFIRDLTRTKMARHISDEVGDAAAAWDEACRLQASRNAGGKE